MEKNIKKINGNIQAAWVVGKQKTSKPLSWVNTRIQLSALGMAEYELPEEVLKIVMN